VTGVDFFTGYILLVGIVAGVGLLYLLYIERYIIEYDPFFILTVSGLFLFIIGGPALEVVYPDLVHWIHGFAACLVLFGLYSPVQNDLRKHQWTELLLAEPAQIRASSEWMVPMDDAILSVFYSSDLVLTPAIIAYNIDYSRAEVNRRLTKLEAAHLVEKVERGKYRITSTGEAYLSGEFSPTLP
jgi:DNA-binding transcriptional ArsR family regulator